jgi:hypothetical protein
VRVGESIDDVRSFFDLHLHVGSYKYQLLAQPWPFFEHLWTHLSAGPWTSAARRDGRTGARGVLFLEWAHDYYKFNASTTCWALVPTTW